MKTVTNFSNLQTYRITHFQQQDTGKRKRKKAISISRRLKQRENSSYKSTVSRRRRRRRETQVRHDINYRLQHTTPEKLLQGRVASHSHEQ